jgi:hypothetical protein
MIEGWKEWSSDVDEFFEFGFLLFFFLCVRFGLLRSAFISMLDPFLFDAFLS